MATSEELQACSMNLKTSLDSLIQCLVAADAVLEDDVIWTVNPSVVVGEIQELSPIEQRHRLSSALNIALAAMITVGHSTEQIATAVSRHAIFIKFSLLW